METSVKAVLLGWSGTTVDFGCRAQLRALTTVLAEHHLHLSEAEAKHVLRLPLESRLATAARFGSILSQWKQAHSRTIAEEDMATLQARLIVKEVELIPFHSHLIPGWKGTVEWLRERGIRIGTTTGYRRQLLDLLLHRASLEGFRPDSAVCAEDVGGPRPAPWMCYESAIRLKVYPLSACIDIGDTPADIEEGRNAGMWTVGVTASSRLAGMTLEEWNELNPRERDVRLRPVVHALDQAGAHYTVYSVAELPAIVEDIEARLRNGERP